MVSQCANPECGAPFLYLREGRLFAFSQRSSSPSNSTVEYFWLCGKCAEKLRIAFSNDCGVRLAPRLADRAGLEQAL